jgi:hypothetical protein
MYFFSFKIYTKNEPLKTFFAKPDNILIIVDNKINLLKSNKLLLKTLFIICRIKCATYI